MRNLLIEVKDFKGGASFNDRLGRPDQFSTGTGLDFITYPSYLTLRPAFANLTGVVTSFQGMTHGYATGEVYFGGGDNKIYKTASGFPDAVSLTNTSANATPIRDLFTFGAYTYYPQSTTIGRFSGGGVYTDSWQTLTQSDFHPVLKSGSGTPSAIGGEKMYVGHGRYVASWDDTTWTAQALDLQAPWEISCMENFGIGYMAIGANYGSGTYPFNQAKIFLWSRLNSTVWDDEIPIPEAKIYAMRYASGYLWIWAGSNNVSIYVVPLNSRIATKIHTFENENPSVYTYSMYPNAVKFKEGRLYFGISGQTFGVSSKVGVYSIATNPNDLRINLERNLSGTAPTYITSLETVTFNNQNAKGILYISYNNSSTYYVLREKLYNADSADYADSGSIETMQYDAPPGKRFQISGVGIDLRGRTPMDGPYDGTMTISYDPVPDGIFTTLSPSSFSAQGLTEIYYPLTATTRTFKLKLSIGGSTFGRPYIKRIYVMGTLVDDPRG